MQHSGESPARKAEILAEAIHKRQMVEASYNGATMKLAPHQLFVRHDSLYVRALNPAKPQRVNEDPVLGVFKLDGMSQLAMTGPEFDPVSSVGGQPPRPDDMLLTSTENA